MKFKILIHKKNISAEFFNIELISQYSKWLIQCSLSTPKIWSKLSRSKNSKEYDEREFKDDRRHGQGKLVWSDGRVYDGGLKSGKLHGCILVLKLILDQTFWILRN